jgi:ribonuclease D
MDIKPAKKDFDLAATPDAMPGLLEAMRDAERIAVDTEADSYHHFHHKICLIQVAVEGRCWIVDPLAGLDLSEMMSIMAQKQLVFHDAGYDLRLLLSDFGFRPQGGIFDTMLAARLVGLENFSLSAVLEQILGIRLSKHNQRANWAKRPIEAALLAYAAEDIRYLEHIADALRERLDRLGRTDWHREYCEWTIAQSQIPKAAEDPEKIWRIRGTTGLKPRQLAFVRAVWQWRQAQSSRADVAPFRVLRNEQLLELALWAERQKEIRPDKLPPLPRHCTGHRQGELIKSLQKAFALNCEQWPLPLPPNGGKRPSPEVLEKAEQLHAHCRRIAQSLALPTSLIASRKSLLAAVNTGADTEEKLVRIGWMRWQAQLVLPALREVLG